MKRKILSIFFTALMASVLLWGCKKNTPPALPQSSELTEIIRSSKEKEKKEMIDSPEAMETLITEIRENARLTRRESVQDEPVHSDETVLLTFVFQGKEGGESKAYIYREKNRFYFEQPYVGIWRLPQEVGEKLLDFSNVERDEKIE